MKTLPRWADVVNGNISKYLKNNKEATNGRLVKVVAVGNEHNPITEALVGPVITVPAFDSDAPVLLTYTVVAREDALARMQEHLSSAASVLFQKYVEGVTEGYMPEEVTSWAQQRKEAEEYTLDSSAVTPLIDSIVSQRDLTKTEIVDFINTNAAKYAGAVGFYLGRKQAIQDLVYAPGVTMLDLENIEATELKQGWEVPVA